MSQGAGTLASCGGREGPPVALETPDSRRRGRERKGDRMEPIVLTDHARMRLGARRIPAVAVEMAFLFGREWHVKGATYFVIGRKEVEWYEHAGVDLGRFEGSTSSARKTKRW